MQGPPAGLAAPDLALVNQWKSEAEQLKGRISFCDSAEVLSGVRLIGGLDLSFVEDDPSSACACLIVSTFPDCNVVFEDFCMVQLTQPYVPGFLAFREADFLVDLLEKLRRNKPELFPQIVLVDGNGILHQQACGLACHVGVRANVSAIGVAKTFFQVDGLDYDKVRTEFQKNCRTAGSWIPLQGDSGAVWGAAVATVADLKVLTFI